MNKITDFELKKYYAEVSSAVICERKKKSEFMKDFMRNVDEYVEAEENVSIEDIKQCFGTAETIGKSFIDNSDAVTLKKKLSIKKYVLIFMLIALIIYAAFVVASLIDVHIEARGYFKEGIIVLNTIIKGGIS